MGYQYGHPRHSAAPAWSKPAEAPLGEGSATAMNDNKPHLLIVDDDREIRTLLGQYFETHGYRTSSVSDGRAMRKVLAQSHVDLIVLDVMLPGEDGLSLCRDLRSRSQLPVIMLTARGDDVDRIVGLEVGADDYVPKPFNPR